MPRPLPPDRRAIWRLFAEHYRVFRATPSRLWLDHVFATVFGFEVRLSPETADHYFDTINATLATPEYLPRALYQRFNIEVLATTEGALDALEHHAALAKSGWKGRIITTFDRTDVVDPDRPGLCRQRPSAGRIDARGYEQLARLSRSLGEPAAFFRTLGATATDHGHPTARTADLSPLKAQNYSIAFSPQSGSRATRRPFARKCSPKWRRCPATTAW